MGLVTAGPGLARFQSVDIRQPLMLALPKAEAAIVDDLPKGFRLPEGELPEQTLIFSGEHDISIGA